MHEPTDTTGRAENILRQTQVLARIQQWFLENRAFALYSENPRGRIPADQMIIRHMERLEKLEDMVIDLWHDNARVTEETLQGALHMTDDEYRLYVVGNSQRRKRHPDVDWGAGRRDDAED